MPPFAVLTGLGISSGIFPVFSGIFFGADSFSCRFTGLGISWQVFPVFMKKIFRSWQAVFFFIKEAILSQAKKMKKVYAKTGKMSGLIPRPLERPVMGFTNPKKRGG